MAQGMKYPKDVPAEIQIRIGQEVRTITDTLSDLSITPHSGCWDVTEILRAALGFNPQLTFSRTLETYPTMAECKAYIEGFLAGQCNRKNNFVFLFFIWHISVYMLYYIYRRGDNYENEF